MTIQILNEEIMTLFNSNPGITDYFPTFLQESPREGGILFVGYNPSRSKRNDPKIVRAAELTHIKDWDAYCKKDNIKFKIEDSNKFDSVAGKNAGFFSRFNTIVEETNKLLNTSLHRAHMDLFFIREAMQKNLDNVIFQDKKQVILTPFAEEQFDLQWKYMEDYVKPRFIVVANANSAKIISSYKHHLIDSSLFEANGFSMIKLNGRKVPIILTAHISGIRSIDNGTFEILKWLVRQAVIKEKTIS